MFGLEWMGTFWTVCGGLVAIWHLFLCFLGWVFCYVVLVGLGVWGWGFDLGGIGGREGFGRGCLLLGWISARI